MLYAATSASAQVIDIPDVPLRRAFEAALTKQEDEEITRGEMETVHDLTAHGVTRLAGIEYATNLRQLSLQFGEVSDLSQLAGLSALFSLRLHSNDISDVTPLADLALLAELSLYDNPDIVDYGPLANLRNLADLDLRFNGISSLDSLGSLSSLNRLYLGNNAITDLAGLPTQLKQLHLEYNAISDLNELTGLGKLTSLTHLSLSGNRIRDVTVLATLTSLRHLALGNNGIVDVTEIAGLMQLRNIYTLRLDQNRLLDLTPLTDLVSLRYLDIGETGMSDLSWLSQFPLLTYLWLGGNGITDLTPLRNLSALEFLYAPYNYISDLTPLSGFASLSNINLTDNYIADLSPLLATGGIRYLHVRNNPLSAESLERVVPALLARGVSVEVDAAEALDGAERAEFADASFRAVVASRLYRHADQPISVDEARTLTRLYAPAAEIADLGGIEKLPNLRHLDLRGNGIEDITPLAHVTSLQHLYLGGNSVTDVAPLAHLDLQSLALDGNGIGDISALADARWLTWLAIDGNDIDVLPQFGCCLNYLYASGNVVADIATLENQSRMVELDLSDNRITSLSGLAGMTQLEHLHLGGNDVSDIGALSMASLSEIHLRNNAVGDLTPLLGAERLAMVDVRGNPLADDALQVLDTLRERRVTVLAGETVPLFPAAGEVRQGFVRVINHGDEAGHVFVEAVDDDGVRAVPVRLELGARQAVHFNSADLEYGNAAKGLDGIGAPTSGDWRLSVISALDVEVLSYIRTEDGFVTAMHDVAPDAMAPFFNPGSNRNQRGMLRVVNTEAEPAKWTTGGYDDRGSWRPMAGSLLVRPQHALTLTAQELEHAHGLGEGSGKWRLRVRGFPWFAMSLLESPTGHLTNLSTAPAYATPLADGATLHRLPLFPASGGAREGFARLINRSYTSGEATIWAIDDAGTRSGPVRLTMRPRQAVHFNSMDLEGGNAAKGLFGSVGVGQGDWRLEITSELNLMALAYARTPDGFLTSLHDVAPRTDDGDRWIPFFNPGENSNQESRLRLANWGRAPAEATIAGVDDDGRSSVDVVRVTVPAHGAREYTAAQLEAGGAGVSGALGDGRGKWRLRVSAAEEVDAMSLLTLPTGHMTNLSTTLRYSAAMLTE